MAETKKQAVQPATDDKAAAAPKTADKPDAKTVRAAERERRIKAGECVVDDGTAHVGRAVNGVVCSAHAMQYDPQGNRRSAK